MLKFLRFIIIYLSSTFRNERAGSVMQIRDVRLSDQGQWACIGNNSIGGDSIVFEIFVQVPPQIIRPQHKTFTTILGKELEIECVGKKKP